MAWINVSKVSLLLACSILLSLTQGKHTPDNSIIVPEFWVPVILQGRDVANATAAEPKPTQSPLPQHPHIQVYFNYNPANGYTDPGFKGQRSCLSLGVAPQTRLVG